MDCLTMLSITSHTNKHNNKEADIIQYKCLVCTCFNNSSLGTVDMNRHGKCYN